MERNEGLFSWFAVITPDKKVTKATARVYSATFSILHQTETTQEE